MDVSFLVVVKTEYFSPSIKAFGAWALGFVHLSLMLIVSSEDVCEINNDNTLNFDTFRCLDGNVDKTFCPKIVSMSKVNDDICDCCDGSDESNMSCSNLTAIFQDSITYNSFLCNKIVDRVEFHDDVTLDVRSVSENVKRMWKSRCNPKTVFF